MDNGKLKMVLKRTRHATSLRLWNDSFSIFNLKRRHSFLFLDEKKRIKEKSRLRLLRNQKFVVSVSAKSNSQSSNSDLATRNTKLDF
mgnify:CR=1 FL=1